MKKIALLASVLVLLSGGVFIGYKNYSGVDNVSANPDYICKKAVTNSPCNITSCGEWDSLSKSRQCVGTKTTEVSYYHVRTACEAGYTIKSTGAGSGAASGRQGADYVSNSQACTLVQSDTDAPRGVVK